MIAFLNRNVLFTLFLSLSLSLISTVAQADVMRSAFTSSIQNREPVDNLKQLNRDLDAVFYFTEVANMKGRTITHKWKQGGIVYNNITFEIGSHRWRVNSSKGLATTSKRGTWVVTVTDDEGVVLKEESISYGSASSRTTQSNAIPPAVVNKPKPKAEPVAKKPQAAPKKSDEKPTQAVKSKTDEKPEKTVKSPEKKTEESKQASNKDDKEPTKKEEKPVEKPVAKKTEEAKPQATEADDEKKDVAESEKAEKTAAQALAEKKASIKSQVLQATGRAENDEFENFDKEENTPESTDKKDDEPKTADTDKDAKTDNMTNESEKAEKTQEPATETSKKDDSKAQEKTTLSSKQPSKEDNKSATPKPIWDTL